MAAPLLQQVVWRVPVLQGHGRRALVPCPARLQAGVLAQPVLSGTGRMVLVGLLVGLLAPSPHPRLTCLVTITAITLVSGEQQLASQHRRAEQLLRIRYACWTMTAMRAEARTRWTRRTTLTALMPVSLSPSNSELGTVSRTWPGMLGCMLCCGLPHSLLLCGLWGLSTNILRMLWMC